VKRLALVLFLAGCCATAPERDRPPATGDPWDTSYLLDLDPSQVTIAQLASHAAILEGCLERATVEGVTWKARRSSPDLALPDRWADGGDSGIFSGYALATVAFRYGVSQSGDDLTRFLVHLRGVYLLTHATGTPGVICRCAFPVDRKAEFGYPAEWEGRLGEAFVHEGPEIQDPVEGGCFPRMIYHTRATKDQLTGILFGLAVALHVIDEVPPCGIPDPNEHGSITMEARRLASQIARSIHDHLVLHGWDIRDEKGENDTNADHVDGLMRLQLLAVLLHSSGDSREIDEWRASYDELLEDVTDSWLEPWGNRFTNWTQYYAHNLRAARTLTVWLLDPDARERIRAYSERAWWRYVRDHRSAWFDTVWAVMSGRRGLDLAAFRSLALKPTRLWSSPWHDQLVEPSLLNALWDCMDALVVAPHLRKPAPYFVHEKAPWDVGTGPDLEGLGDTTGLGFLLPWHLARYEGLIDP